MISIYQLHQQQNLQTSYAQNTVQGGGQDSGFKPFGDDGITFSDLIDIINPLQHIPIIGNLYRKITGDIIDPAMRVAGGALFGGPVGAGISAISMVFEHTIEASREDQISPAGNPVQDNSDHVFAKSFESRPTGPNIETTYGLKSIPMPAVPVDHVVLNSKPGSETTRPFVDVTSNGRGEVFNIRI